MALLKNPWVFAFEAAINWEVGTTESTSPALRMRVHSVLLKKKSFLNLLVDGPPSPKCGRTTGPPNVYPNWLRVKTPRGIPLALSKKPFDASREMRLNSYAEPWKSFDPARVATLIIPPEARPYSAEKLLVTTRNSLTASSGTCWPTPAT